MGRSFPKMNMSFRLLFCFFILVLLMTLLLAWQLPISIDQELERYVHGILFRMGEDTGYVPKNIYINGVYSRYLFQNNRFQGTFEIEGFDITTKHKLTGGTLEVPPVFHA